MALPSSALAGVLLRLELCICGGVILFVIATENSLTVVRKSKLFYDYQINDDGTGDSKCMSIYSIILNYILDNTERMRLLQFLSTSVS